MCTHMRFSKKNLLRFLKLKVVSGHTNWGSEVGSIDSGIYWYVILALEA